MDGSREEEVKPAGPVQLKELDRVIGVKLLVRLSVPPEHTGALEPILISTGIESTVVIICALTEQIPKVATTLKYPPKIVLASGITGFCSVDVNVPGPVQL